jgi:hypothetical protein
MNAYEVTTIYNQSSLSMHLYIVEAWKWVAILFNLQKVVDGSTSNTMTSMIVENLTEFGGLIESDLTNKLVCFGIDGVTNFLRCKNQSHHTTHDEICTIFHWCALHGTSHKSCIASPKFFEFGE